MYKTLFTISQMDCPSEERLIRLKLDEIEGIAKLEFDIANRQLTVWHIGSVETIVKALRELSLGDELLSTIITDQIIVDEKLDQKKLLWTVLGINFAFFLFEIVTGILSISMGLIADSLDMLADSFVYGISLLAVGGTLSRKKSIATIAGYVQLTLAFVGFLEVLRRFFSIERLPNFTTMIVVSTLALIANAICLYLLQRSKSKDEVHLKASMIFTSNDVIINLGVIVAGVLVMWLNSNIPDLIIGTIVFLVVMQGAFRILKLGK